MPLVKLTLFEDPVDIPDEEIGVLQNQGLVDGSWKPPEPKTGNGSKPADRKAQ
jgi:hypothetical protein